MQMKAYSAQDKLIVSLDGEIDHHSAAEIREGLDKMIAVSRPKVMVLELSGIDFMDSSGLGLVLGRYRRLNEMGSQMVIKNPGARTEKILAMAGVDKLIKIIRS
ncbi:MAG: anti-anti-sigma factor [Clostridiales bacterium]|nr:MAG: anti-anti-sigma factor [Clostridiales bacterium]